MTALGAENVALGRRAASQNSARHSVSVSEQGAAGSRIAASQWMQPNPWLRDVERVVCATLPNVEISRPDDGMLTLALGTRAVVLQVAGDTVIFAPSFAAGGTIGSRLADRVQHLEMTSYAHAPEAVTAAAGAVVAHLQLA
jgi:hypothetical protein